MTSVLRETAKSLELFFKKLDTFSDGEKLVSAVVAELWPVERDKQELIQYCLQGLLGGDDHPVKEIKTKTFLRERAKAARIILWKLGARRYPGLVFRLPPEVMHSTRESAQTISN